MTKGKKTAEYTTLHEREKRSNKSFDKNTIQEATLTKRNVSENNNYTSNLTVFKICDFTPFTPASFYEINNFITPL